MILFYAPFEQLVQRWLWNSQCVQWVHRLVKEKYDVPAITSFTCNISICPRMSYKRKHIAIKFNWACVIWECSLEEKMAKKKYRKWEANQVKKKEHLFVPGRKKSLWKRPKSSTFEKLRVTQCVMKLSKRDRGVNLVRNEVGGKQTKNHKGWGIGPSCESKKSLKGYRHRTNMTRLLSFQRWFWLQCETKVGEQD